MKQKRAFTFLEVTITLILLTAIGAVAVQDRTTSSSSSSSSSSLSVASTLQTLRSQIELFKIQHIDTPPDLSSGWFIMLGRSTQNEIGPAAGSTTGTLGPYLAMSPVNPVNGNSAVGTSPTSSVGWVYFFSGSVYTFSAVDTTGTTLLTY